MVKYYKPVRIAALFIVMGLLVAIYMLTLYRLQLFDTSADAFAALARETTTQEVTLAADRGDILDRNGVVLVSTRAAYNITLSRDKLLKRGDINEIILKLVHTAIDNGVSYTDTFPVTSGAPFAYLSDMTSSQRNLLNAYFEYFKELDPNKSASDLIVWMKKHYDLDYTTNISDARLIIGVRYEMEIRAIVSMNPYVFASDVSSDFLSLIKEAQLPGVNVEPSAVRVYHTPYAAHLLGHIGKMTKEQYEKYKELDYSYNSIVGQSGVEQAFEEYLHGTDGLQYITTSDKDGTVLDVYTEKTPTPGKNVFLSIDIGLQAVCENSLAAKIDLINTEREEEDRVTGGAVVVTAVNTGEVLALCSYPSYDLANYSKIVGDLLNNKNTPLVNRATTGLYNPGSTFKMVTALAGLKYGVITPSTTINCIGKFTKYEDYKPVCWIYSSNGGSHGPETVRTALRDSCNYFFYTIGDELDIDKMAPTAADFGLGSKTGIELPDKAGILATREWKRQTLNDGWWAADNLLAAIGQGNSQFTPIQLANYVATIANGGTRYSMTVLNHIRSADYTSVVHTPERKVLGQVAGSEYLSVIQDGMKLVASDGTAKSVFKNYPIPVAAKTGTVQSVHTMGKAALNTGVFVCYAPANDPEIAISIVVEKGTSGSTIMEIARDVMDYYFDDQPAVTVAEDNTLLP